MSKNRQAIKPLNQTAEQVATAAAAEKARKAASRKALRDAKKVVAIVEANEAANEPAAAPTTPPTKTLDHSAVLDSMRIDYDAECEAGNVAEGTTFTQYLADQGFDPAGNALPEKTRYMGPMLALVSARRSYVKATNGILCNGDALATLCGHYKRDVVCRGLVIALGLGSNPYLALNEGQQSMNLRNRARHAIKNGVLTLAEVTTALQAAYEG